VWTSVRTWYTRDDIEERPRPGTRYRCQVCRLELILDDLTDKLTVTPLLPIDEAGTKDRT